jgi:hypothetical protein
VLVAVACIWGFVSLRLTAVVTIFTLYAAEYRSETGLLVAVGAVAAALLYSPRQVLMIYDQGPV